MGPDLLGVDDMTGRKAAAVALACALVLGSCTSKQPKSARGTKKTLRVAVLYTTAGQGGGLAQAVLGATGLVVARAKALGVEVQVVNQDYAGNIARIPKLLEDAKSRADAIVVGTNDPAVEPALRATTDIPLLYPVLSDDALLTGSDNAFRFGPSNKAQAEKLVGFLAEHRKYRKMGILSDDTSYGKEGRTDLLDAMASAGVTPTMDETFIPGRDVHTSVAHAGQLKLDALIIWSGSESEAARIVVDVQKQNFAYQIALSGNLANDTFAKNASSQVTPVAFRDGLLSVGTWAGPWFRLQRIIKFYDDFKSENSALAPVQAASMYDAVLALVTAAQSNGTTPSDLTSGLESLHDFVGAGVPLTFGPDKHDGIDADDLAVYGFTKDQNSAGGEYFPDVDTGGGFFTVINASLDLPKSVAFLSPEVEESPTPEESAAP
ncbi:MAG: ABC transporter substrate-binding protein [Actinomycetota bacterium]|nr:ABC transporter substrate-binding protein [Actinomycetota bacterium]